jgi:ABC-2 type transport system permease protein
MRHSLDRLTDMFYWPAMDLLIWGLTGLYLAQLTNKSHTYLFVILSGLVFWIVIWRAQYEITTNLLAEIWDRNIVNLFTTPLRLSEWIIAFMIIGVIKIVISFTFSAALAFFIYGYSVFSLGGYLFLYIFSLLLTGWWSGFIVAAILVRYGQKLQTIAWAGVALIAPFSAVYYPLSVLPAWAQKISLFLPSTYVFEDIRHLLFTGSVNIQNLLISFALNVAYLTFSIWFFIFMFNRSKKLGLGRLI